MNGVERVGIVGAGRMGRALTVRIGIDHVVEVVSRQPGFLTGIDGRPVLVGDDPAVVRGCGVVLLAIPAPEVVAALRWVTPYLGRHTLVVNLATELATSTIEAVDVRVVGCKIIGQSGLIERGVPAVLALDGASVAERDLLSAVLSRVGTVIEAPEGLAAQVNEVVSRRMVAAQLDLAAELEEMGLPEAARRAAIGNLAPGVWAALATGNTGPFLTRILADSKAGRRG